MINKFLKFSILLVTGYWLLVTGFSFAEAIDPNAVIDYRLQLEQELQQIEAQINSYSSVIQEKQKQSTTLERDIAILDAQIAKIKLEIKATNLRITQLEDGISQKSETISGLINQIEQERATLAELIRETNGLDAESLIEIILGYDKLSDFFVQPESFESLHKKIQDSLIEINATKDRTEQEKNDLEGQKTSQVQLRATMQLENKRLSETEDAKKIILKTTKGEEAKYQKILAEQQKNAATIRSQLFLLTGSPSIPFEKAVEYATLAWKSTGVRPAFLLGVIAEESNMGANIGTGNWNVDIADSRCASQRNAFIQITAKLGLNPDMMPVSKKSWYGYCGGAMGPAQFMPTTWLLYEDAISAITGNNPPSPWDPKDAFVAAALLLKNNGAANAGYTAERKAALKYLAGGNWNNAAYSFYGDDVMDLATKYQTQIDIISK